MKGDKILTSEIKLCGFPSKKMVFDGWERRSESSGIRGVGFRDSNTLIPL